MKESVGIFQENVELFTQELNHYGLNINISKSKTLVFRKSTISKLTMKTEIANQLIYLSNVITSGNQCSVEIKRITLGNSKITHIL